MGKQIPITFEGVEYPSLRALCNAKERDPDVVYYRVRQGWSLDQALDPELRGQKCYTFEGVTYPNLKACCKATGRNYACVAQRVRDGVPFEEAMILDPRSTIAPNHSVTYNGVSYESLSALCRSLGLNIQRSQKKKRAGMSIEEIVDSEVNHHSRYAIEYHGIWYDSEQDLCDKLGISYHIVHAVTKQKSLTFTEAVDDILNNPDSYKPRYEFVYNGAAYNSIKDCCNKVGVSYKLVARLKKQYGLTISEAITQAIDQVMNTPTLDNSIVINGVTYRSKTELCRELKMNLLTIKKRMQQFDISFEEAVYLILKEHEDHLIEYQGVLYKSVNDLCSALDISYGKMLDCRKRHMSLEDSISFIRSGVKRPKGSTKQWRAVTVNGITYPSIKTACKQLGLNYHTIYNRVKHLGMSVEKAFSSESYQTYGAKEFEHNGVIYPSFEEFCRQVAPYLTSGCIEARLRNGMSIEEAIDPIILNKKAVVYNGVQYESISKLCEATGASYSLVVDKLLEGMSPEEAVVYEAYYGDPITYNGVTYPSIRNFCKMNNVSTQFVYQNLKQGRTIEEIMSVKTFRRDIEVFYDNCWWPSIKKCCDHYGRKHTTVLYRMSQGLSFEEAMAEERFDNRHDWVYKGEVYDSIMELCRVFDRNYYIVTDRLRRHWSLEDAMDSDYIVPGAKEITCNGVVYPSISECCRANNMPYHTVTSRLYAGLSIEHAISLPPYMSFGECKVSEILDTIGVSYLHNKSIKQIFKTLDLEPQYKAFMKAYQEVLSTGDDDVIPIKTLSQFRFDFAVTEDGNLFGFIEYDGAQHNKYVTQFYKTLSDFLYRCNSDDAKSLFAELAGIPLLRIRHDQDDLIEDLVLDFLERPEFYVTQHNKFLTNEEYFEERDEFIGSLAFAS